MLSRGSTTGQNVYANYRMKSCDCEQCTIED